MSSGQLCDLYWQRGLQSTFGLEAWENVVVTCTDIVIILIACVPNTPPSATALHGAVLVGSYRQWHSTELRAAAFAIGAVLQVDVQLNPLSAPLSVQRRMLRADFLQVTESTSGGARQ